MEMKREGVCEHTCFIWGMGWKVECVAQQLSSFSHFPTLPHLLPLEDRRTARGFQLDGSLQQHHGSDEVPSLELQQAPRLHACMHARTQGSD